MGRLAGISWRKAVAAFRRAGWELERQKGSHLILSRPGKPSLVLPAHRTIAPFLLRSQIRRAGLTEEEFLARL